MRLLLPIIAVVLCAACSRAPEPPAPPSERDTALQRTIEEPQQRAKAVEGQIQAAKTRVDDELDAAEAKPATPP